MGVCVRACGFVCVRRSCRISYDEERSHRSRGFGFVSFATKKDGKAAIEAMNGADLDGRYLDVREVGGLLPSPGRW